MMADQVIVVMTPTIKKAAVLLDKTFYDTFDVGSNQQQNLVRRAIASPTSGGDSARPKFVVSQFHGGLSAMSWFSIVEPFPCVEGNDSVSDHDNAEAECVMKYVVWGTGKENDNMLYDLTNDPDELVNHIYNPQYAWICQVMDAHLKTVVDYEAVAQEVATYNHQSFQSWVNVTANWKDILADKSMSWHESWKNAGNQSLAAVEKWLSEPPQVNTCRKDLVWPPPLTIYKKL